MPGVGAPPSARAQEAARLELEVKVAHVRTRETCGPERLQRDLADHGIEIGIHRIRQKLGLRCKQKKKFKATTDSKHNLPVAPNLLDRNFNVSAPNQAWVGDLTYVATDEGWVISCRTEGSLQRGTRWLCDGRADEQETGDAGIVPGCFGQATGEGTDSAFRSGKPILFP